MGGRIAAFEAAIAPAASRPDSEARLQSVMSAAADLAGKLRGIQSEIQAARSAADARIGREVDELNAALGEVDGLNTQIVAERAAGRDASALFDQRQAIVDRIARIVPPRATATRLPCSPRAAPFSLTDAPPRSAFPRQARSRRT